MTAPAGPHVVTVTPRQRAVIGEVARDGADDNTIALRLGISTWTVKTHMRRALAATGADNRTHLVCLLLRGHLRLRTESQKPGPRRENAA